MVNQPAVLLLLQLLLYTVTSTAICWLSGRPLTSQQLPGSAGIFEVGLASSLGVEKQKSANDLFGEKWNSSASSTGC